MAIGLALSKRGYATACLDVSDGISTDLGHLCEASGVRAEVELDKLPVAQGATLEQALHGGEDYELLFTAMAGVKVPTMISAVKVTRIGTVLEGRGVWTSTGKELAAGGWEHLV